MVVPPGRGALSEELRSAVFCSLLKFHSQGSFQPDRSSFALENQTLIQHRRSRYPTACFWPKERSACLHELRHSLGWEDTSRTRLGPNLREKHRQSFKTFSQMFSSSASSSVFAVMACLSSASPLSQSASCEQPLTDMQRTNFGTVICDEIKPFRCTGCCAGAVKIRMQMNATQCWQT